MMAASVRNAWLSVKALASVSSMAQAWREVSAGGAAAGARAALVVRVYDMGGLGGE